MSRRRAAGSAWAGEQSVAKDDPDPKALACYGLLLRLAEGEPQELWLRFVDGRPVSAITIPFLADCCDRLAARGKRALLLVWDNASWHISKAVKSWIRAHNQQVKREGCGVRILACQLPVNAPWLNPIEPKWVHGKRALVNVRCARVNGDQAHPAGRLPIG